MNPQPHWQSNYPVRQSAEHAVTRRQFAKFACCSAVALGAGMLLKDKLFSMPKPTEPLLVARLDEVPVGGSKLFRYPTPDHPCILVRLAEDRWAAFSQSCTHLMCPVHFKAETRQLVCPCHEGFFSAEDGRVLAGPPPQPLPSYPVEVRDGNVWVKPA
jgi:cytochrome b6-f complex iron-sulfur subunit